MQGGQFDTADNLTPRWWGGQFDTAKTLHQSFKKKVVIGLQFMSNHIFGPNSCREIKYVFMCTHCRAHSEGESLREGGKKRLGGNMNPENGDIGGCMASCVVSEDYTIDQLHTLGGHRHDISCGN